MGDGGQLRAGTATGHLLCHPEDTCSPTSEGQVSHQGVAVSRWQQ